MFMFMLSTEVKIDNRTVDKLTFENIKTSLFLQTGKICSSEINLLRVQLVSMVKTWLLIRIL